MQGVIRMPDKKGRCINGAYKPYLGVYCKGCAFIETEEKCYECVTKSHQWQPESIYNASQEDTYKYQYQEAQKKYPAGFYTFHIGASNNKTIICIEALDEILHEIFGHDRAKGIETLKAVLELERLNGADNG